MAEHAIGTVRSDPGDVVGLSMWLANAIVGPVSGDDVRGRRTPSGARVVAVRDGWSVGR